MQKALPPPTPSPLAGYFFTAPPLKLNPGYATACALPHSSQSSHYQDMTMAGRAFIIIAWHAWPVHNNPSQAMTWIGEVLDLNLAEEDHPYWHFNNVVVGTFREQNYPQLTQHVSVSIWQLLAQNHTITYTMLSKAAFDLRQWWWLGT